MNKNKVVSFDDEPLIVVDANDNILGYKSKLECHQGEGILHRAFSIFIFNNNSEVLLQQRSRQKLLWPSYWSNSCCSHPRKDETTEDAAHRRLKEELGIQTILKYLYTFQYQVKFGDAGSENERCAVFIGKSNSKPVVNENEISAWKYTGIDNLSNELIQYPDKYTPWFKMEWDRLSSQYMFEINKL